MRICRQAQYFYYLFFEYYGKTDRKANYGIDEIEKSFQVITSMPGIGHILGLTVMVEADDFSRFESPGNYASYCRCVKSERTSNKKKKGEGNRKNGNKYLAWAYVEAAHLIIRFCPEANALSTQKGKNQRRHSNKSIGQ